MAEATLIEWVSNLDRVALGTADCLVWPDGAPPDVTARFGAFDLAGNFSGWTSVPVELPSEAEAEAIAAAEAGRDPVMSYNVLQGRPDACAMTPLPAGGSHLLGALSLALGSVGLAMRRSRR